MAFAQLGMQFSLIMDKCLVVLGATVTKFPNGMIHLPFPPIFADLLIFA